MALQNIILYIFFISITGFLTKVGLAKTLGNTKVCESYTFSSLCNTESQLDCFKQEKCEKHKKHHCLAVWSFNSTRNQPTLLWKGCLPGETNYYKEPHCLTEYGTYPLRYKCYCDGDMCNENITYENIKWNPLQESSPSPLPPPPPSLELPVDLTIPRIVIAVCVLFIALTIVACVQLLWLENQLQTPSDDKNNEIKNKDKNIMKIIKSKKASIDLHIIKKIDIIANGNFGTIWKGQLNNDIIAIKIIKIEGKESWENELSIFKTPQLSHPNILRFIGGDERKYEFNDCIELWIVTDYHSKGSLCDYLKNNVISWEEMCKIAETMVRGLMHLHSEIPATMGLGYKPVIAHRDFKSKNVLIKADLSACIADFGLAHAFGPGDTCGNRQVGTKRYMAPEVLEGSINFSKDSFLRIDMYAFGLVLWELLTRCTVQDGPVGEYMLPFEKEFGSHVHVETMKKIIIDQKKRPEIPESWRANPLLLPICETIEECWDDDADARLSAFCVAERLTYSRNLFKNSPPTILIDSTVY